MRQGDQEKSRDFDRAMAQENAQNQTKGLYGFKSAQDCEAHILLQNHKDEASKNGQVTEWLYRLTKELAFLFEITDRLEAKLKLVTREIAEDKTTGPKEPEDRLVPLAAEIRDRVREVEALRDRLESISVRIEI
jgi:hypothetical protein